DNVLDIAEIYQSNGDGTYTLLQKDKPQQTEQTPAELASEVISHKDAELINKLALLKMSARLIAGVFFVRDLPKRIAALFAKDGRESGKKLLVNYHFIKESGIIEAIKEFGSAAALTPEGYVNLPVYVINGTPENDTIYGFKPAGVNIDGAPLYISTARNAVIVYAKGAGSEAIDAELASNRKINEVIKTFAGKSVGKNLKNISAEWIQVDSSAEAKDISYSEKTGNPIVRYGLFKEMLNRGKIFDFTAAVIKNKNQDAFMLARGTFHYLSNVNNAKSFRAYLDTYQKIGNGQIVINPDLAKNIINEVGVKQFSKFLSAAAKEGVRVHLFSPSSEIPAEFKEAGFAGFLYHTGADKKEIALRDFTLGSGRENDDIKLNKYLRNYSKDIEEDIAQQLKNSTGPMLIDNADFNNMISEERDPDAISRVVAILSGLKILKTFSAKKMDAAFARNAARNFDLADVPAFDEEEVSLMMTMYNSKKFDDIISLLGIKDLTDKDSRVNPLSVYMAKLKSRTQDIEVRNAFLEGMVERILTAKVLKEASKAGGLENRDDEIILGRVLVLQLTEKTAGKGVSITPESLGNTMKEAQDKLYATLHGSQEGQQSLMEKAFDSKDPQAINSIIELIVALDDERRKPLITDKIKPAMNVKNYESMLTAA
ncbi:MAG: hypothetical protein FWC57_01695, partial [Endomicrobia bacterium]|nr:hypothetical protein [Endomicrobiia bacterium]